MHTVRRCDTTDPTLGGLDRKKTHSLRLGDESSKRTANICEGICVCASVFVCRRMHFDAINLGGNEKYSCKFLLLLLLLLLFVSW